jgi:outer membrane protein TolC
LISYYASRRGYEDLHEQVAADVRTAVRAIRQAQNSVAIQRRSIELALRRLDNASTLLRLGASPSTRDYVEAQSSLLSAQDAYDRAKANLQVQVLTFLRQIGTLRVDPAVGTLGKAMDREGAPPVDPDGNPRPLNEQLIEPGAPTQSHVSAARVGKPAG